MYPVLLLMLFAFGEFLTSVQSMNLFTYFGPERVLAIDQILWLAAMVIMLRRAVTVANERAQLTKTHRAVVRHTSTKAQYDGRGRAGTSRGFVLS